MSSDVTERWLTANRRYLELALAELLATLRSHLGVAGDDGGDPTQVTDEAVAELAQELGGIRPSLDTLTSVLGLSDFERQVLVLCAGFELDGTFGSLCAALNGEAAATFPTFAAALAALAGPHWSAVTQTSPLRRWKLVELGDAPALLQRPLRISERILSYLLGVADLDQELLGVLEPVATAERPVDSHLAIARRIRDIWAGGPGGDAVAPVLLCGADGASKRAVAAAAARAIDMCVLAVRAEPLLGESSACTDLLTLCQREALITGSLLFVDADEIDTTEPGREASLARLAERLYAPHVIATLQRFSSPSKPLLAFDVDKPAMLEQRALWSKLLTDTPGDGEVRARKLATQFNLAVPTIRAAAMSAAWTGGGDDPGWRVWDECRALTRRELDLYAQRIDTRTTWKDLVLPDQQLLALRELVIHVRNRDRVYEEWGFAAQNGRGLGISALFAGPSGTGKTMAAEVLAADLRLDLYRVDLSATVSKYIGETEKNLQRIFNAADAGGAILLFDEADALFGKRSEVRDGHDRYANIEVSYLLQRLESYRGLAILTTNLKDALDRGFLRRIRFVVEFPFPQLVDRHKIWQRVFPPLTPTDRLDPLRLARLNVTGANIRSIAMNAAFLASEACQPVCMGHVLQAARSEYTKLEKPLTEIELAKEEA